MSLRLDGSTPIVHQPVALLQQANTEAPESPSVSSITIAQNDAGLESLAPANPAIIAQVTNVSDPNNQLLAKRDQLLSYIEGNLNIEPARLEQVRNAYNALTAEQLAENTDILDSALAILGQLNGRHVLPQTKQRGAEILARLPVAIENNWDSIELPDNYQVINSIGLVLDTTNSDYRAAVAAANEHNQNITDAGGDLYPGRNFCMAGLTQFIRDYNNSVTADNRIDSGLNSDAWDFGNRLLSGSAPGLRAFRVEGEDLPALLQAFPENGRGLIAVTPKRWSGDRMSWADAGVITSNPRDNSGRTVTISGDTNQYGTVGFNGMYRTEDDDGNLLRDPDGSYYDTVIAIPESWQLLDPVTLQPANLPAVTDVEL